jgi:hypothetical protein
LFLYNQFNFKYNIVLNFFHYINYTMNTEALFLFLILLLGLVLCSFLGGNCNKEGFDSLSGIFDAGANAVEDTANAVGSVVGTTANAVNTVVGGTANAFGSAANSVASGFDNYNHYTGSGSSSQLQNGMVFTDASGDTVTVITNSNGTQSLQMLQSGQTTPMVLTSTPPASSSATATANTFYAPFGGITATVITGSNGQTAIQFNLPNGQAVIFTQSSGTTASNTSLTSTQYYGSTGYPIQQSGSSLAYNGPYGGSAGAVTGPGGNTAYYAQGPYGNTVAGTNQTYNPYYNEASSTQYNGPYGGSAGAVTGPGGNTAYYAQGPYGNTVAGTSSNNGYGNNYYSTMPPGIPASQIPPGQEDLYILKSEVVPPVCPACPSSASCPRQEKCPPCPACARCPEPSFECKKVPNYNAINDDYLPQPVIADFSQFGM